MARCACLVRVGGGLVYVGVGARKRACGRGVRRRCMQSTSARARAFALLGHLRAQAAGRHHLLSDLAGLLQQLLRHRALDGVRKRRTRVARRRGSTAGASLATAAAAPLLEDDSCGVCLPCAGAAPHRGVQKRRLAAENLGSATRDCGRAGRRRAHSRAEGQVGGAGCSHRGGAQARPIRRTAPALRGAQPRPDNRRLALQLQGGCCGEGADGHPDCGGHAREQHRAASGGACGARRSAAHASVSGAHPRVLRSPLTSSLLRRWRRIRRRTGR